MKHDRPTSAFEATVSANTLRKTERPPRGGLPVAAKAARTLNAPLDLVLIRKVGVPFQPELAMGAVVDGGAPIMARKGEPCRPSTIRSARDCHPYLMVRSVRSVTHVSGPDNNLDGGPIRTKLGTGSYWFNCLS